jgi:hypothetical protein
MLMGALHWLLEHYEKSPDYDHEVARVTRRLLNEEPRVIAADLKLFRKRHLSEVWPYG